jgi:hypothetical protein
MTVTTLAALVHRSPARIYEVEHAYPGRGPNAALRAAIVDALAAKAPAPVKPKAKRAKTPIAENAAPVPVAAAPGPETPAGAGAS